MDHKLSLVPAPEPSTLVSVNRISIFLQIGAGESRWRFPEMNARNEIRVAPIIRKMKYWLMVAQHPFVLKNCPAWRARKNYWHLCAKYPEIATKIGVTKTSVYEPF